MGFRNGAIGDCRAARILGVLAVFTLMIVVSSCAGIPRDAYERGRKAGLPWAQDSSGWVVSRLAEPLFAGDSGGVLAPLAEQPVILFGGGGSTPAHRGFLLELVREKLRRLPVEGSPVEGSPAGRESGQIVLLQEGEHALGWLVHDYVHGERDSVPPYIRQHDMRVVGELRELQRNHASPAPDTPKQPNQSKVPNQSNQPRSRIDYRYVGINEHPQSVQLSLHALGAELGEMPLFVDILEAEPGGKAYAASVRELAENLSNPEDETSRRLRGQHGARWYARIVEILQVELHSLALRGETGVPRIRGGVGTVIRQQLEGYTGGNRAQQARQQLIVNTRVYPQLHRNGEYYCVGVVSEAKESAGSSHADLLPLDFALLPLDFAAYLLYPASSAATDTHPKTTAILFARRDNS